jgi:hypothetical protein
MDLQNEWYESRKHNVNSDNKKPRKMKENETEGHESRKATPGMKDIKSRGKC